MTRIVLFILLLVPLFGNAATTTYDYSVRNPGVNIFAYEGASTTQVPNNNTFPVEQHSQSEYEAIAANDGSGNAITAISNNSYASLRYVIEIDEDISNISQIDFLWNGEANNTRKQSSDGVLIYIWNFSINQYQLATSTTASNEVSLTFSVTSNPSDYIDGSNNRIIIYVVSQDKTQGNSTNQIITDYVQLAVTAELPPPSSLLANFQFDECAYSGTGNEVIDQLGSYSGTSHNAVNTSSDAQIVKALAISNAQHHVRTSIPLAANFSVSTWFKKPSDNAGNRYFVLGAMSDGGDLFLLDRDNSMRWAVYNPVLGNVYGTYSFNNLDASWHHMALVFRNNETSLYIDGNFIEAVGAVPSGTLGFIGTSFDEVNSANPQGFRAPIDEFMVFNGSLTSNEVSSIYNNQLVGRNYDGGTRETTSCAVIMANFQFDECEYTGAPGEVIDQIGNANGTSFNGVTTSFDAQIEKALAITNAQQHFQTNIPLPESFTVSTWFKKPTTTTGNQYFVLGAMEDGGDLLVLDRVENWTWLVYNGTTKTFVRGTFSFASLDDNWHHMALVYHQNATSLYIDGDFVETINITPAGTLKYIGTSFDELASVDSQGFRAPLDEFIVFDNVLTAADITEIYNRQVSGENYDGTIRENSNCPYIIANYKFDEKQYENVAGEVIDSIGTFHGRSKSAQTAEGKVCRALDLTATGTQDYVVLDESVLNNKSEFSISLWAKTAVTSGQSIISGATDGSFNELWMWFTNHEGFRPYLQSKVNGTLPITSIAGDVWRHIVWTQGDGKSCVFIDTVAQGCLNQTTSLLDIQVLIIGQDQDTLGGGFASNQAYNGLLDELVIFEKVIEQEEINQIYNYQNNGLDLDGEPISCPVDGVHHYEIVHDGNGLTCDSETISIKACIDSDCSSESTESVSLDFTITSPSTGVSVKASPTFTGNTSINFNHTVTETITLSIDGATLPASNEIECTGFGSSCEMTFANAGFRFLSGDLNSEIISPQTAGVVFGETLKLQAVANNNGACVGLLSSTVTVELSQENVTPDLDFNPGLAFQASGINIAKFPDYTDNIILIFGSDSIATINSPKYLDAGKIRLHAKYQDPLTGVIIVGSSNDFWVKPDSFAMAATNASGNLNGNTATSATTHKAGENFNFLVKALNADGDVTQNYRQSDGQIELKVSRYAPVLGGSVDDRFTYADGSVRTSSTTAIFQPSTLTSFINGAKGQSEFTGAHYDEVGIINVDIQDSNYGGLGGSEGLVSADDLTIGRFTPAYFKQTVKDKGKLDAYHSSSGLCAISDWAYSGERTITNEGVISYSLEPKIAITAYNAKDEVTKNYTLGESENFMKLAASGIDITLPTNDDSQQIVGSTGDDPVTLNAFMNTGNLSASKDADDNLVAGEWIYTFSNDDHFSYDRNDTSFLAPFDANIPFVTSQVEDTDGILLALFSDSTGKVITDVTEKMVTEGVEIRFARMVLENSYGSENAQLRAQLKLQVYDGDKFNLHTDDSCLTTLINDKKTGAKYSGNMNLWDYRLIDIDTDAIQVGDTDASISGAFESGLQQQLFFSPPSKQGSLEWEYEVPSWFKFKWNNLDEDNDGNFYDDNPSSVLSFGIYRGNDRIISWREVSN